MRRVNAYRIQGSVPNASVAASLDLSFLVLGTPNFPHAACLNRDPEWWSDKVGLHSGGLSAVGAAAVAICDRCVHETECLQWALDQQEPHGILGGLTPTQRKELMQ